MGSPDPILQNCRQHRLPVYTRSVSACIVLITSLLILITFGCKKDTIVVPAVDNKTPIDTSYEFALPCPLAGFSEDYVVGANSGKDHIPSVDNPVFSPASEADWLSDDDNVLGVVFEGQPLAIPVRIMIWHEIVNISGTSGRIAVTYCPLTLTGISFDLEADFPGEVQSLGVSGWLFNSNLVIYDRKTDSLWPQMSGSAYDGSKAGSCLTFVPTMDTTFRFWKILHPDTKVLDRPGKSSDWQKYDLNPYESYWQNDALAYPVPRPLDKRINVKEQVLGVMTDTGQKAFPIKNGRAVNESLPGVPFVAFMHAGTAVAYKAWIIDGERLRFSFAANGAGGPTYTDDRTGSTWNFKGTSTAGPLAGNTLVRMPSYLGYYFAWSSYYPGTLVYTHP